MTDRIPPSRQALTEALNLSNEILRNLELSEIPLTNIALKTSRLARLLNDFDMQAVMEYEAAGYPTASGGVAPDVWRIAVGAGRRFQELNQLTKEMGDYVYLESISGLEEKLRLAEASLDAAKDRDISIASANPSQYVMPPATNYMERQSIRKDIATSASRLASRRSLIHRYVSTKYSELRFSGLADDIFARIRERVDAVIGKTVPDAVKRLSAVDENLRSENPEDWSNAVHSCRRILQDLADAVFPPRDETREAQVGGKKIAIKLGKEQYINRIIAFVEDRTDSSRFQELVGSHIRFLGDRIDSVFQATQKGSHTTIVKREEADRYVVYTYLLVGDILSLLS